MLGKLDKDIVESIITMTTGGLTPELTLLLDCDVEVAMHRVSKRDSDGNRYDNASLPLHKEIRQSFLKLSETFSDRVVIIDAGKSNTDALAQSIDAINNRLDND
jgi:dTMP kinase